MGNAMANNVSATITDASATANSNVTISAKDEAPSLIPSWIGVVPRVTVDPTQVGAIQGDTIEVGKSRWRTGDTIIYDNNDTDEDIGNLVDGETYYVIVVDDTHIKLAATAQNAKDGVAITLGSPGTGSSHEFINKTLGGSLDLSGNILALNIGVAAASTVAVNVILTGNVIANTVLANIEDSTVTSTLGAIDMDAESKSSILALTIGVAGSGTVAVNATGFGNVIVNRWRHPSRAALSYGPAASWISTPSTRPRSAPSRSALPAPALWQSAPSSGPTS